MENEKLDLTVVVCSYNSEALIKDCLLSVKANNPKEIILVDANSKDRTVEIAGLLVDKILYDGGKGLGNARNIGLETAASTFISFVGPDNIMPAGSLKKMIEYLDKYDCAVVSAVTILRDTDSYLGWAQNIYRLAKERPGYTDVAGTPTLFKTELLKKYKYDTFMKNSDDTDLCERMARDGYKFAVSDAVVYEVGFTSLAAVCERWTRYGRGDCLFYKKFSKEWSVGRKIKSYCHPFFVDFLIPVGRLGFFRSIPIIPFLVFIVSLRYYGWLKTFVKSLSKKSAFRRGSDKENYV